MISPVSTAITSPGLTSSSMTATSLKSPMSGTLTSTSWPWLGSLQNSTRRRSASTLAKWTLKRAAAAPSMTRWSHDSDSGRVSRQLEVLPSAGVLLPVALAHAHDRDLGRVDDRREVDAADAAERADREGAALHLVGLELAVARQLGELAHLLGDLGHRLLVDVADHRHHQAVGRVGGEADVPVVLQHQRVAVEAGVELGELLQRRDRRLHHERQHADLDARLLQLLVHLHAELLEVGDVGLVVRRHVRDHDPVAVQVGAPRSS